MRLLHFILLLSFVAVSASLRHHRHLPQYNVPAAFESSEYETRDNWDAGHFDNQRERYGSYNKFEGDHQFDLDRNEVEIDLDRSNEQLQSAQIYGNDEEVNADLDRNYDQNQYDSQYQEMQNAAYYNSRQYQDEQNSDHHSEESSQEEETEEENADISEQEEETEEENIDISEQKEETEEEENADISEQEEETEEEPVVSSPPIQVIAPVLQSVNHAFVYRVINADSTGRIQNAWLVGQYGWIEIDTGAEITGDDIYAVQQDGYVDAVKVYSCFGLVCSFVTQETPES